MISTMMNSYLETLTGYIFDEDKLVTYKWLSKELGVHVNLAKQILWEFWKQHKNQEGVSATFTLMGYLVDDSLRVEVVKEADLARAKEKFTKLMTEHLYSLQRTLPNLELLALTENGNSRYSAIICKEIFPRDEQELSRLRWGSKLVEKSPVASAATKSTSKTPTKVEAKSDRNKIHNLFAKTDNRVLKTGLGNSGTPHNNVDEGGNVARGHKRHNSNHSEQTTKRQKKDTRKHGEHSSSSEEMEEDRPPSPPQPVFTDAARTSVSPPAFKIENGKRKARKTINKTFTDKKGYLVTKKEYVYESCSDKEEEAPKPEPPKPKPAGNTGRKQASLFNFFKKS